MLARFVFTQTGSVGEKISRQPCENASAPNRQQFRHNSGRTLHRRVVNPVATMNHFIHNHDASTWLVQGFSEVIPLGEETYFRATASKYGTKFDEELSIEPSSTKTRVVSVCIPCFNEEASALERTLKSLRAQKIPPGHVLEILIVMDGVQKMSKSMHTYLHTLFGLRQDTETDNPFHQLPDAETIVVESIDSNTVHDNHGRGDGVSLILKRNNQRKVNSQMWWLGGHARDSGCEFALATDCGIIFEQTSIARMLCRLDQDQTLAAVTGFQRVMTASMQGDGPNELLTDPMGYALRQIQRFDFEIDQSTTKSAFDSVGFMPVLPGPCGLYRYKELGSLKEGVMHEYFSLCCQPVDSIIFGNVQLSEDRIPSCLLVFRDESKNKQAATNHKPRTGFVHDAVFYFEAEKPLSQLVKQRRRWINGTYAAYLWVFREGWLWKGNHEFYIKLFATAFVVIQLLQGAFVRLCGPSVMAVGLYTSCLAIPVLASNSYKVMLQELYEETAAQDTSQESRIVASLMALAYLTIYSIFVFGHTPRAIPVRDDSSREISVNSRFDDFSGYLIRSVKYRSDRRSAYRPRLFALAFLANALVVLLLMALCVSAFLQFGWAATPLALRLAVVFLVAPYGVAFLDGIINSRRPNVTSVFTLIWATPCFLLASIWFYIWLPAYATARISDLSWGNRDNGCDEQDSSVAKHREIVGKKVGAALVMSNFVVAGISICLVHMVPGALQVVIIFCVGVPCVHYAISVIDMLIRLVRKFIRLVRKVVSLCCISAAAKRRTGYSDSLEMLLKAVNMNSFEDKPCFFVFNVRGKSDGGYSLQKTMRLLPQDQGVDSHVPETVLAVSSDNTRQAHGGSGTSPRMVTNFSEFNESLEDSMTKRDKAISKAVALKTLQDNRDRAEKKMTNLYDDILILSGQRDREARVIMMYQRAKAEYVQLEHKVSKLTGIHFDDSLQEDWEWFLQPQYLRRFAVAERGGTEAEEQKQAIAVGQQELFDVDDSADHSVARQQHEGPEGEASVGSCDSSLLSTFFSVYEEDTASLEPPRKIRLVVV